MDYFVFIILAVASSCFHAGIAQELTEDHNEFCEARPTLIATDKPSFHFFPYYVTLHRCGGSAGFTSPLYMSCVPAETQDVRIRLQNLHTSEENVVIEKNHTSCKKGCTNKREMCDPEMEKWNEPACKCDCKYPERPPEPCPARFKWDPLICSCECSEEEHAIQCQREQKVWSYDKCGCECPPRVISRCKRTNRVLDEKTCRCVIGEVVFGAHKGTEEDTGISQPLFIGIVIGELLLLLFIFDLILCTRERGVMYNLWKCVGKAVSTDKQNLPPPSPRQNHDKTTYL